MNQEHPIFPDSPARSQRSETPAMQKVLDAAIEVAYDPGKQPALVLTLIELGFIKIPQKENPT
jgi:hypothetical protein